MQTCKYCQSTLPDNVHICPFCGNPIQKDNNDARKNLLMRLRLGTISSPLAVTASVTPYLVASTLILGFVIVGLFLRPPTATTLNITPFTLDFGKLVVGQKAVKTVVIETSSVSNLTWKIVSGNPQWVNITQSNVMKESDNLSEVVFDVAANTSNLHEGKYSVIYNIDVGGVKDQHEQVNFQVIPPPPHPLPPKLNVDPQILDFGTQNVGSQMTKLLTVSNSGQLDLNWMADKGNARWLTLDANQGKIAAGGSPRVIKVTVNTATLTTSSDSAVINFTSNGGTASVEVKLNVGITPTTIGPQVNGVNPSSGLNDGGTMVVITGTGFTGASIVSFGPVQVAANGFTVNGGTKITIVSPPANQNDLNSTVDVTVTTSIGTSATSHADQFTYYAPMLPTVTKVSPNVGSTAGGTNVIINGTGFTGATGITFGTVPVAKNNFMVNSDTQITAVSPAPAIAGVCTRLCYNLNVDVTVTTPFGTSNTNGNDKFTYISPPIVSGVTPNCGPYAGGTSVTITGIGFTGATGVTFGTVPVQGNSFVVNSDTQITAVIPKGSGAVDVFVTTPGGTSATTKADVFTYIPLPDVASLSPASGPANGGTYVTINGSGFTTATSVLFGSTKISNFTIVNDNKITVVSPAGSGAVDVTVTSCGGTSATSLDDQFSYTPPSVMVKITNPANNSSFGSSRSDFSHTDPITFTASATDSSGQPLTGTALQWTVDGKSLGTGESFSAALPSGCGPVAHTVKVVATDSTSGLNASDTITVNTGQGCIP